MERDYEHRYPTIHDKVRYTDLSSCESALHKLAEQVESVNDYYIQTQQQQHEEYNLIVIYNSLLLVDVYIDSLLVYGTEFRTCSLKEKKEFVRYLKHLLMNSEYIQVYKRYRKDPRLQSLKHSKKCFNVYNTIKNKMNGLLNY